MKKRDIVECIIFNKKEEFLLQKKTTDYIYAPGAWCLFGGEIEPGEDPEQTIKRELKEETGIDFTDLKLLKANPYKIRGCQGTTYIFLAEFYGNLSRISLAEGAGFAFLAFEELEKINVAPMDFEAIKIYRKESHR